MALGMDPLLKELVEQQLSSSGVLSKLKAQLRAYVFAALESSDDFSKQHALNASIVAHLNTDIGTVAASLVREFLQQLGLEFTLSVFDSEIGGENPLNLLSRSDLGIRTGCDSAVNEPILCQLLRNGGGVSGSSPTQNPLNNTYVRQNDVTPDNNTYLRQNDITPEHNTYIRQDDVSPDHSLSTHSVEEDDVSNDGRCTPTDNSDRNNQSINLLMFTPVAANKVPSSADTHKNADNVTIAKDDVKRSPLGDLPPLMTSSSHSSDIRRMLHAGLATLNQNNAGSAEDSPSSDSPSEGVTLDETRSKLSDADVTDTVSV